MKVRMEKILGVRRIKVSCEDCSEVLHIYAPTLKDDDLYEVGGVLASRSEWSKLFRRIGIK